MDINSSLTNVLYMDTKIPLKKNPDGDAYKLVKNLMRFVWVQIILVTKKHSLHNACQYCIFYASAFHFNSSFTNNIALKIICVGDNKKAAEFLCAAIFAKKMSTFHTAYLF